MSSVLSDPARLLPLETVSLERCEGLEDFDLDGEAFLVGGERGGAKILQRCLFSEESDKTLSRVELEGGR